jgi:hypothetical protein
MIAPKPAPPTVPTTAPFSLVVSGSEHPRKNIVDKMAAVLFISHSLKFEGYAFLKPRGQLD